MNQEGMVCLFSWIVQCQNVRDAGTNLSVGFRLAVCTFSLADRSSGIAEMDKCDSRIQCSVPLEVIPMLSGCYGLSDFFVG
jgi:hypothetical protein